MIMTMLSGESDDLYALGFTMRKRGYIVSNDMYRDHMGKAFGMDSEAWRLWLRMIRIGFTFFGSHDEFLPNPDNGLVRALTTRALGGNSSSGGGSSSSSSGHTHHQQHQQRSGNSSSTTTPPTTTATTDVNYPQQHYHHQHHHHHHANPSDDGGDDDPMEID